MNWTGGGLQRHSTANSKSIALQRQKQHFARAQQKLRTGGIVYKNSPAKFSVFGIDVRDRERLDQKVSSTRYSSSFKGEIRSQRSQAGLASTAYLPPPENWARPRDQSQEHESYRCQRLFIKGDPSPVLEDDLYNATPPPRPMKRKRNDSESDVASMSQGGRREKESLSDIKKRLLRRGDWVGITTQKPLQLAFGSVEDANDIGRRRKVTNGQKAKYRSAQSHIISPFAARSRLLEYQSGDTRQPQRTHIPVPDVRISIGGRTVPPGVSSSIGQRRGPLTSGRKNSRAVSSDFLLLDNDSFRPFHNKEHSRPPTERSAQTSLLLESSPRAASQYRSDRASEQTPSRQAIDGNDGSSQHGIVAQENGWTGVTARSLAKLQRNFQKLPSSDDLQSSRPKKHITPAIDLRQILRSGQEVFSSSSASMRYPKPQSSRISVLLREESSLLAESRVAQVGIQEPKLPSSQLLQNEMWQRWVLPQSQGEEDNEGLPDSTWGSQPVSPGVSGTPPVRLPSISIPDEEANSSELEEPLHHDQLYVGHGDTTNLLIDDDTSNEEENDCDGYEDDCTEVSHVDINSQYNEISNRKCTPSIDGKGNAERTSGFTDSKNNDQPIEFWPLDLPAVKPLIALNPSEDPDEVWRKFVFGSSATSESRSPSVAEPFESIVAHPSSGRDLDADFRSTTSLRPTECGDSQAIDNSSNNFSSYDRAQSGLQHSSPPVDGRTNVHATNGSAPPSSSEKAPTTMAVRAKSQSSISYGAYSDSPRPQRGFVFSKPKPFVGQKSHLDAPLNEEPLYIGRGLRENNKKDSEGLKSKRAAILKFADIDEQDELESIEDG
ncbi:uncharacterized protein RCO7_00990 [Rhynchosporium graminicola]|uniref:Uncharacterized protein n=1 Tax=Rhynchosporium graminicola TaxID=2792576 RepID=A0A1E1JQV6_9HELO|nr:uncharacterized protein RCO7_00990 [Rhynchosporium commune]